MELLRLLIWLSWTYLHRVEVDRQRLVHQLPSSPSPHKSNNAEDDAQQHACAEHKPIPSGAGGAEISASIASTRAILIIPSGLAGAGIGSSHPTIK